MKDDPEFRKHAGDALKHLLRMLAPVGEDYGFQARLEDGALQIEFDSPQPPITITPHAAVHQILFTTAAKTRKLIWDVVENSFVVEATGQSLQEMVEEGISLSVGDDLTL